MPKPVTAAVRVCPVSWKSWDILINCAHKRCRWDTKTWVLPGPYIIPEQNIQYCDYIHTVLTHSKRLWIMFGLHNAFWKRCFLELWKQNWLLFSRTLNRITPEHSNFMSENKPNKPKKKVLQAAVKAGKHVLQCWEKWQSGQIKSWTHYCALLSCRNLSTLFCLIVVLNANEPPRLLTSFNRKLLGFSQISKQQSL